MRQAHYSVIRYIADPGRNEPLNVGIVVWDERDYRLRIDAAATERVIRENPYLARDGLRHLELSLHTLILADEPFRHERMLRILEEHKGFPVLFSEPRFTTIVDDDPIGLEDTLDRLVSRVVTPKRRFGGGGLNIVDAFERRLHPLIQRRVVLRDYFFQHSKTGLPRAVTFYTNSNTNVALDVVRLALKKADEIRLRADAEAFKVEDVLQKNDVNFVVYCDLSPDERLAEVNRNAKHVLESVGAKVETDFEGALRLVTPNTANR